MRRGERLTRVFTSIGAVISCLVPSSAQAQIPGQIHDLYTGARAEAMGNAFTGLADDEEAIFYNPAGLAGIRNYSLDFIEEAAEVSNDTITSLSSSASTFNNLSGNSLNVMMGKNVYLHSQFTPSFTMPSFGFVIISDQQFSLISRNEALPQIQLGLQETNGFQAAYGFSVLNNRRNKKDDLRFGIAFKMLYRRGGYHQLTLDQVLSASPDTLRRVTGDFGQGFGFDVGTQYIHKINSQVSFGFGADLANIGDVSFTSSADPQLQDLSLGAYAQYKAAKIAQLTMTYDLHHVLDSVDWRQRNHFGLELGLPLVSFYAGINQVSPSYGIGVSLWLIHLTALSYSEEEAAFAGQDSERRYMLQVGLKFGI